MKRTSFAEKYPRLAKEWSEENLPWHPDEVSYGSNHVFVWKCRKCGNIFRASPHSRSENPGCPYCTGKKVLPGFNDLETTDPDLAAQWSPRNGALLPRMVTRGSHKKVWWLGHCDHEWQAEIKNRTERKSGCPYCSGNAVLKGFNDLKTRYPYLALQWSSRNGDLLPDMVSPGSNRDVWWKCSRGHEWDARIADRVAGSGCPYCSGERILSGFNDLGTTNPDLAAEWSDSNIGLTPTMVTAKSCKNVWWKCNTCGYEWKAVISSRVKGLSCPVCADRKVLPGVNDLATTDSALVSEWSPRNRNLLPSMVSRYSARSVWWRGHCDHEWKAKVSDRAVLGKGCTICEHVFQKELPGEAFLYYSDKLNLNVLQNSDEPIGVPLQFYIQEKQIAVEFLTENSVSDERLRWENAKNDLCRKAGITMIRITRRNIRGLHDCTCIRIPTFDEENISSALIKVFCLIEPDTYGAVNLNLNDDLPKIREQWNIRHNHH